MNLSDILSRKLEDIFSTDYSNRKVAGASIFDRFKQMEEEHFKDTEKPFKSVVPDKDFSKDLYNFFAIDGEVANALYTADNSTDMTKALTTMLERAAKNSPEFIKAAKKNYLLSEPDSSRLIDRIDRSVIGKMMQEVISIASRRSGVVYVPQNFKNILFKFINSYKEKNKNIGRAPVLKIKPLSRDELTMFGVTENDYDSGLSKRDALKAVANFLGKEIRGHADEESHFVVNKKNKATENMDDNKKYEYIVHFLSGIEEKSPWLTGNIKEKARELMSRFETATKPMELSEDIYKTYFGLKGKPTADLSLFEVQKAIDYILGLERDSYNATAKRITKSGLPEDKKEEVEDYLNTINELDSTTKIKYIQGLLTDYKEAKKEAGEYTNSVKNFVGGENVAGMAESYFNQEKVKKIHEKDPKLDDPRTKNLVKRTVTLIDSLDDLIFSGDMLDEMKDVGEFEEEARKVDEVFEHPVPDVKDINSKIKEIKKIYNRVDLPENLKDRLLEIDPKTLTTDFVEDKIKDKQKEIQNKKETLAKEQNLLETKIKQEEEDGAAKKQDSYYDRMLTKGQKGKLKKLDEEGAELDAKAFNDILTEKQRDHLIKKVKEELNSDSTLKKIFNDINDEIYHKKDPLENPVFASMLVDKSVDWKRFLYDLDGSKSKVKVEFFQTMEQNPEIERKVKYNASEAKKLLKKIKVESGTGTLKEITEDKGVKSDSFKYMQKVYNWSLKKQEKGRDEEGLERTPLTVKELKSRISIYKEDIDKAEEQLKTYKQIAEADGAQELQEAVKDYASFLKGYQQRSNLLGKKDTPRLEETAATIKAIKENFDILRSDPNFLTSLLGSSSGSIYAVPAIRKDKEEEEKEVPEEVLKRREKREKEKEEIEKGRKEKRERFGPVEKIYQKDISEEEYKNRVEDLRARTHPLIQMLDKNDTIAKIKVVLSKYLDSLAMPWYNRDDLKKNFDQISEQLGSIHDKIKGGQVDVIQRGIVNNLVKKSDLKTKVHQEGKKKKKKASNLLTCVSSLLHKFAATKLKDPKGVDWFTLSQKMRPAGKGVAKKDYVKFFDKPDQVSKFIEALAAEGFRFFKDGKEVSEADPNQFIDKKIDTIVARVLLKGKKRIEDKILSKAAQRLMQSKGQKKNYDKFQESIEKLKEVNTEMSESKDKYLPKLNNYALFFNNPRPFLLDAAKKEGIEDEVKDLLVVQVKEPFVEKNVEELKKAIINKDIDKVKEFVDIEEDSFGKDKFIDDDVDDIQKANFKPYGEEQTDPLAKSVLEDLVKKYRKKMRKEPGAPSQKELKEEKKQRVKEEIKEKEKELSPVWDKAFVRRNLVKFVEKYVPKGSPVKDYEGEGKTIKGKPVGEPLEGPSLEDIQEMNEELERKNQEIQDRMDQFAKERKTRGDDFLSSQEAVDEVKEIEEKETEIQKKLRESKEEFEKFYKSFYKDIKEAKKILDYMKKNIGEFSAKDKKTLKEVNKSFEKYNEALSNLKKKSSYIKGHTDVYETQIAYIRREIDRYHTLDAKGISPEYQELRSKMPGMKPLTFRKSVQKARKFIKDRILVQHQDRYISDLINAVEDYIVKNKQTLIDDLPEDKKELSNIISPFLEDLDLNPNKKAAIYNDFKEALKRSPSKTAADEDSTFDPLDYVSYPEQRGDENISPTAPPYKKDRMKTKAPEPKIRDIDVAEHLLGEDVKQLKALKEVSESGELLAHPDIFKKMMQEVHKKGQEVLRKSKIRNLEVRIGNENVPVSEAGERFGNLLEKYQDRINYLKKQRQIYQDIAEKAHMSLQEMKSYVNPRTGEFKGFPEEYKQNIVRNFHKQLFWDLQKYWMTTVGRNNVFGGREYAPYMQIFETFKNLFEKGVKSDPMIMEKIRGIDSEVRDLKDVEKEISKYRKNKNLEPKFLEEFEESYKRRMIDKRELERKLGRIRETRHLSESEKKEKTSELLQGFKSDDKYFREEFGSTYKELRNLIEKRNRMQKKKKKGKSLDALFEQMLDVADKGLLLKVLTAVEKRIQEDDAEEKEYIQKMKAEIAADQKELAEKVESITTERAAPEEAETPKKEDIEEEALPAKTAFSYASDKNFNMNVYYSPKFQKKLAEFTEKAVR